MISAVTDADGERLTQPVGVAIAPDGAVLFTDVGRDAVLEHTPPAPVSSWKIWIRRTLGLRRDRNHCPAASRSSIAKERSWVDARSSFSSPAS